MCQNLPLLKWVTLNVTLLVWTVQMTYSDGASLGIWLNSVNYFDFEVEIINQGHRNINLEYLRWKMKVFEILFCGQVLFVIESPIQPEISLKSALTVWPSVWLPVTLFSGLTHYLCLNFCMKLGFHKLLKVLELIFGRKF